MDVFAPNSRSAGLSANLVSAEFSADWRSPEKLGDLTALRWSTPFVSTFAIGGMSQWRTPSERNRAIAAVTEGDIPPTVSLCGDFP